MAKKQTFFRKRSVVATFGILALLGAGIFITINPLSGPSTTGNAVNFGSSGSFNVVTLIGFLLLICSIVLIAYSVVHRD